MPGRLHKHRGFTHTLQHFICLGAGAVTRFSTKPISAATKSLWDWRPKNAIYPTRVSCFECNYFGDATHSSRQYFTLESFAWYSGAAACCRGRLGFSSLMMFNLPRICIPCHLAFRVEEFTMEMKWIHPLKSCDRWVLRCRRRHRQRETILCISVVWINSSGAESWACLFINYQYTHTHTRRAGALQNGNTCVVSEPKLLSTL